MDDSEKEYRLLIQIAYVAERILEYVSSKEKCGLCGEDWPHSDTCLLKHLHKTVRAYESWKEVEIETLRSPLSCSPEIGVKGFKRFK